MSWDCLIFQRSDKIGELCEMTVRNVTDIRVYMSLIQYDI